MLIMHLSNLYGIDYVNLVKDFQKINYPNTNLE
jgi:microsomal dipeptidase-like Zn-dependent dipeptidase